MNDMFQIIPRIEKISKIWGSLVLPLSGLENTYIQVIIFMVIKLRIDGNQQILVYVDYPLTAGMVVPVLWDFISYFVEPVTLFPNSPADVRKRTAYRFSTK